MNEKDFKILSFLYRKITALRNIFHNRKVFNYGVWFSISQNEAKKAEEEADKLESYYRRKVNQSLNRLDEIQDQKPSDIKVSGPSPDEEQPI